MEANKDAEIRNGEQFVSAFSFVIPDLSEAHLHAGIDVP